MKKRIVKRIMSRFEKERISGSVTNHLSSGLLRNGDDDGG